MHLRARPNYPFMFKLLLLVLFPLAVAGQCRQGADLSYVNSVEAGGGVYRNGRGEVVDPYRYFAERGAKMIRIRLWYRPENVESACGQPITAGSLEDVLLAARRTDSSGMALNLAIHYSDYFVDPAKQRRPRAWDGLSGTALTDSIYAYTYRVLELLHAQGTDPAIVAIGNETTNGFVDAGDRTDGFNWAEDAAKFNAALTAVARFNREQGTAVLRGLHLTVPTARYGAADFRRNGVTDYDVLGLSFYPGFHGGYTVPQVGELVGELAADYNKEVMIFETGFSWTATGYADSYGNFLGTNGDSVDFPQSPAGQRDFLLALNEAVRMNGGTGVLYWEPAWVTGAMCDAYGRGSSYENASFFDFGNGNRPLPAFDFLSACGTVATADRGRGVELAVYPNPSAGGRVRIESPVPVVGWRLRDGSGRLLGEGRADGDYLELEGPATGLAWLELTLSDGRRVVRRLIR